MTTNNDLDGELERIVDDIASVHLQITATNSKIAACGEGDGSEKRKSGLRGSNVSARRHLARLQERKLAIEHELAGAAHDAPEAPKDGWVLIARKQFSSNGRLYPRGCIVPADALSRNWRAMIAAGYVEWVPPNQVTGAVLPRAAPTPTPAIPNPEAVIIADPDPVQSWKLSLAALVEKFGGDHGRARDKLLCSPQGSKLYDLCVRVGSDRDARAKGLLGRRIVPAL